MANVVRILETPNPRARRFKTDLPVAGRTPLSFSDAAHAERHPAAKALFGLGFVSSVFLLGDSVTVALTDEGDWEELLPEIVMTLEERLEPWSGARALAEHEEELEPAGDFDALDLDGKLRRIEKVLDLKVRPNLAGDGGGVELMGLEDGVAYIHYVGACGSCPSAGTATLEFVRDALRTHVSPGLDVQLS